MRSMFGVLDNALIVLSIQPVGSVFFVHVHPLIWRMIASPLFHCFFFCMSMSFDCNDDARMRCSLKVSRPQRSVEMCIRINGRQWVSESLETVKESNNRGNEQAFLFSMREFNTPLVSSKYPHQFLSP